MSLYGFLREFFLKQGMHKTYYIAYSGGLDSQVLLSLCQALRPELKLDLHAVHVNHQLSPHAKNWALHCRKICEEAAVDYHEENIQLNLTKGDSLEECAREQRYKILASYIHKNHVLLTAHHQDDQAETFLLQLCRGSGPKGLASMPYVKPFSQGFHARPLLHFPREDLLKYAREKKLVWIDDESNFNKNYSRNFIRHDILPALKSRWSSVSAAIARSAALCAENQMLLEELAQTLYLQTQGLTTHTLSVKKLLQLETEKQKLVLRTWIQKMNAPLPGNKKMLAIQRTILSAKGDRMPSLRWDGVVLRKYRDEIFLLPLLPEPAFISCTPWDVEQVLELPHGRLSACPTIGKGLHMKIQQVEVRFRQSGERVEMPGRGGTHSLKKLFQEWSVLPWERKEVPLIYSSGKLIAVAGFFLNENFAAKEGEQGREIIFDRNAAGRVLPA